MNGRSGKLDSVQVLRAVAAIGVVAHHSFRSTTVHMTPPPGSLGVPPPWLVQLGAAGVDIFFVISGFLMTYIAAPYFAGRKSAGQFLAQRVIRIWPPYVFVTALQLLLLLWQYRHIGGTPFDYRPVRLLSFLFVPSFNEIGLLQPILGPGWSLNYEMLFYACFTLTIMLGRRFALAKLAGLIGGLFLLGRFALAGVPHAFLGDPILFEFLIGALIGFTMAEREWVPAMPAAWIGASVAALIAFLAIGLDEHQRLLSYGVPAALLFIGFVATEGRVRWPRFAILLGDASYSIYLVHILIVPKVTLRAGWMARHHMGAIATDFLSIAATIVATGGGILFFLYVERPLLRLCQRGYNRLTGSRSAPPLVAQPAEGGVGSPSARA